MTGRMFRGMTTVLSFLSTIIVANAQDYEWKEFGSLNQARTHAQVMDIGQGRVLVIGGVGVPDASSCEIIDLRQRKVTVAGRMNRNRHDHVVLRDKDSNIIVVGGFDGSDVVSEVERYDRATGTWTVIGNLLEGRRQSTGHWLTDDRILVVGGRDITIASMASAEIFTVSTGRSESIAPFPFNMSTPVSVRGRTGPWVVLGGRQGNPGSYRDQYGYSYNEVTGTWDRTLELEVRTCYPVVTQLWDGTAFIGGGAFEESPFIANEQAYIYDGSRIVINRIGMMTDGRQWGGVAQVEPHLAIVGGGLADNAVVTNSCDWIDLTTRSLRPGPPLNTRRAFVSFISVPTVFASDGTPMNAVALAIGGRNDTDGLLASIEILEPGCLKDRDVLHGANAPMLVGAARTKGSGVELTDSQSYIAGAVWLPGRMPVGSDFTTSFSFRMTDGRDNDQPDGSRPGADGIALVIQNTTSTSIGRIGEGIGYDGIPKALVVEFDTYSNPAYSDPNGNHVAVQTGGLGPCRSMHVAPYNLGITTDIIPMTPDGRVFYGKVDYQDGRIHVYLDTTTQFRYPVLVVDNVDLGTLLGLDASGMAWMGFTSATGMSAERHELLSWSTGACGDVVASVDGDEPTSPGSADRSYIAPMPSRDIASLYSTVMSGEKATVMLYDVTGAVLGTTVVGVDELAHGIGLPFHPPTGTYYIHVTDGTRAITLPWVVIR